MRCYIGFDDTDTLDADRGTGKLARWFEPELPEGSTMLGVVRQQLLVDPAVPYTSHNSSACMVVDLADPEQVNEVIEAGIAHLGRHALDGSDPGLCVAVVDDVPLDSLMAFGRLCAVRLATQEQALEAAQPFHLSGHGGTEDGIIGAAAGVGLTAWGWSGRFIEYGGLRDFPEVLTVAELAARGILAVSTERDAQTPGPTEEVRTGGWCRPRLWGGRAVLPLAPAAEGGWRCLDQKKRKKAGSGK